MTIHLEGGVKSRVRIPILGIALGWNTTPFAKDFGAPTDMNQALPVIKSPLPVFLTLKTQGLQATVGVRFLGFDKTIFTGTISGPATNLVPFHFEPIKGFIIQGNAGLKA